MLGALFEKHVNLTGGWFPFGAFLNSPGLVLSRGFGKLAEGPAVLMRGYGEVLEARGFSISFLEHGMPQQYVNGWRAYDDELKVLLLGGTFVVARDFETGGAAESAA